MSGAQRGFRPNSTIARQHIQIGALVEALNNRFGSGNVATRDLVSLLNSLADHLEMHFELEEKEDYFASVLRKAPQFSERVEQLLREHEIMLKEVAALVEMAKLAYAKESDASELAERFSQFRKKLKHHERAEIDLLQEAYTQDLGSGD